MQKTERAPINKQREKGGYRYLDYQFKSDSKIDNLNMSGPMLGVAFHW